MKPVVEQSDAILAVDGCLNFFAGPGDTAFSATMNFYNVHYNRTHVAATSHGNTDDMREAISMMNAGKLNPAAMITHIGGLDCVAETTANLPKIPGGKKLIYTQIDLPLTAIADFAEKGGDGADVCRTRSPRESQQRTLEREGGEVFAEHDDEVRKSQG